MKQTKNLELKLPESTDFYDVEHQNENMRQLDEVIKTLQSAREEADTLLQELRETVSNKADTEHTHDGRYYTETEVNSLLSGRAAASHTHTRSQITDFPTSMPTTAHTHDDRYCTKTEVNELKKSVSDGKTAVANAVTAKGVVTAADATFSTIAANIGKISTGVDTSDATATDGEVLSGKTFYAKSAKVTGKMANRGAVTASINAGGSYTIPAGYHNGSGKVTGNSLTSQTPADAGEYDIYKGKTGWVNGNKVTGKIADASSGSFITGGTDETGNKIYVYQTSPDPYRYRTAPDMRIPVTSNPASLGITADKIVEGSTILGIAGTGGGLKNIKSTEIKIYEDSTKYYIKLSDYFIYFTDFKFCKIHTVSTTLPNSGSDAVYHDYLLLFREDGFENSENLSIKAIGNRSSVNTQNLPTNLFTANYLSSSNYTKSNAIETLRMIYGRWNVSPGSPVSTNNLNKIYVSVLGKGAGQASCVIEYI